MTRLSLLAFLLAVSLRAAEPPALWKPYYISPRAGAQHVELDRDWQLSWRDAQVAALQELADQKKWIPVSTPSSVHLALHRAGELPHPYYNMNSEQYRWAERKVWYYRKSFTLPESARGKYVMLCFDGLDYFTRIWLNGQLLGRHEGMHGGPAVEIGSQARYGAVNEIVVELRSGNWGRWGQDVSRKPGNVIRGWVFAGGSAAEAFYVFGMWRGARVEIMPKAHIERPFLVTESASPAEARLRLAAEVFVDSHSNQFEIHGWGVSHRTVFRNTHTSKRLARGLALKLTLRESGANRIAYSGTFPLELVSGRNWIEKRFSVAAPRLWWPNGMGRQDLYRAEISLTEGAATLDTHGFDYGIRTIKTVPAAGPKTEDIWHNWQFVVNGRKLFVKGVNWMPADLLLDLPPERYEWLIAMAKNAGFQMFRIWGAGLIETNEFYEACNRHGIMVWQDFTVSNMLTEEWPRDVWEAQVVWSLFRIRNQPSLALYCGGNESNAYHPQNAASIGIFERSVIEFDGTRPYRRTSPDGGGMHQYPDKDPTWYGKEYRTVPFMAETGMHNIPEGRSMREVVSAAEFEKPFSAMYSSQFAKEHPEFRHHFGEWSPSRVPRMLSRASQIDDMSRPSIEALAEASQFGAAEFYQILSEQLQANYPVTTGLLPWVYKRPWPIIAIMLADGFGHPTAPYYFLKRTYEPTHVSVYLPEILWAKGESVPVDVKVMHSAANARTGLTVSVEALDQRMTAFWKQSKPVALAAGPSVTEARLGAFTIPDSLRDRYFFLVAELKSAGGALVSRSVYWPRCLSVMEDEAFRGKYRASPQPALTFDKGPWLKPSIAGSKTTLSAGILSRRDISADRASVRLRVRNTGKMPAFPVGIAIDGVKRSFFASDNLFWLKPGESRELDVEVLWREPGAGSRAQISVSAWNADPVAVR